MALRRSCPARDGGRRAVGGLCFVSLFCIRIKIHQFDSIHFSENINLHLDFCRCWPILSGGRWLFSPLVRYGREVFVLFRTRSVTSVLESDGQEFSLLLPKRYNSGVKMGCYRRDRVGKSWFFSVTAVSVLEQVCILTLRKVDGLFQGGI